MMFTKDVYLILMNQCTHLEILKRIFKVVFLFSYQSSVLKEPCIHQCFFKFLSLPYRGDLIIISPHPTYVNNFFQLFSTFWIFYFFLFIQKKIRRRRDLNPRTAWTVYTLSRGASSATWVLLQIQMHSVLNSVHQWRIWNYTLWIYFCQCFF